jgi:hypothetical protein
MRIHESRRIDVIRGARLVLLVLVALVPGAATGQGFVFQKIVDNDTPVPGGQGTFEDLDPPAIDGDEVAFRSGAPVTGIYKASIGGSAVRIADTSTTQPNTGGETFWGFGQFGEWPDIRNGTVYFTGLGPTRLGVYSGSGGGVSLVADDATALPGAPVPLALSGQPSHDDQTVFSANNSPSVPVFAGVYVTTPAGAIAVVADSRLPPDGLGFFNSDQPTIGGGTLAFHVNSSPRGSHFLYTVPVADAGTTDPTLLVRTGDPSPNGFPFGVLSRPTADRSTGELCFFSGDAIYHWDGLQFLLVADTNTAVPGGTGTFNSFHLECSIDSGDVVFGGFDEFFANGVYLKPRGGSLVKVINTADMLEGEVVHEVTLGRNVIQGNRIAFHARYGSFRSGIFVTSVPEPAEAALRLAALLTLAPLLRRRHRS